MVSVTAIIKTKRRRHQSFLLELADARNREEEKFPDVLDLYVFHSHVYHNNPENADGGGVAGPRMSRQIGLIPGMLVSFYNVQWKLSRATQRLHLSTTPSTTISVCSPNAPDLSHLSSRVPRVWLGRLAIDNAHRILQMRFEVQARLILLKKLAVEPM
jgi:hypothetical protein